MSSTLSSTSPDSSSLISNKEFIRSLSWASALPCFVIISCAFASLAVLCKAPLSNINVCKWWRISLLDASRNRDLARRARCTSCAASCRASCSFLRLLRTSQLPPIATSQIAATESNLFAATIHSTPAGSDIRKPNAVRNDTAPATM